MSTQPTLAFFPTRSHEGIDLQEQFVPCAKELGFDIKVFSDATPPEYAKASWNDDVVVLDASVEKKGQHNYEIIFPTPLDHLLVVSRTYLPLNFYGLRDSIVEPEHNTLIYGTPFYPNSQTNEDILRWLELQLQELLPSLPRPKQERGVWGALFKGGSRSCDIQDLRRNQSGQIFISYRSKDSKKVEQFKQRIEQGEFHNGESRIVRYFPPGALSDEVMTEQRRWQILSMLDRFIGPASEVWVYETEDYYDSWWTLGELTTLTYRDTEGYRGKRPPKLRIFNPDTDSVCDAPPDYLPKMTEAQRKRMARWYANCDTAQMGPESVVGIRLMPHFPLIGPLLGRLRYFQDHVWTDEFWKHPILDCPQCRQIGKNHNHFDLEAFLWTKDPSFHRLTPEQMQAAIERQEIICPCCQTAYRLEEAPLQYLWMPVVNGHRTGYYWMLVFDIQPEDPEEFHLVPLPAYRLGKPINC
ncbi:hypothetical protein [Gloeocapsa sp. PCC 73106]|uniref:hypothetical protein n=1 Tax=Gloeocapsa sp. PCC 73106 TaxID=102232 RepID=UPI0002ACE467|nr:hypothetical protein [Gloeocapsa sp. PCC 73106]ELR98909.1 hypothetical protein GLO73106DRAFT_00027490 [Gloeocapsa sp. PCC 73106]